MSTGSPGRAIMAWPGGSTCTGGVKVPGGGTYWKDRYLRSALGLSPRSSPGSASALRSEANRSSRSRPAPPRSSPALLLSSPVLLLSSPVLLLSSPVLLLSPPVLLLSSPVLLLSPPVAPVSPLGPPVSPPAPPGLPSRPGAAPRSGMATGDERGNRPVGPGS